MLSNLGGQERAVACPWCRGGGERVEGIDAQAHWLGAAAGAESG